MDVTFLDLSWGKLIDFALLDDCCGLRFFRKLAVGLKWLFGQIYGI